MKRLRDLVGQELQWTQPRATKREFELRAGEAVIATLRFRSSLGSFATAESAEGGWTFKRVGFWQTRATIRAIGSDAEVGIFRNNTWANGGTLELPDGRCYLANSNFWMTEYSFRTEGSDPLVVYRKVRGVIHLSSIVDIRPAAAQLAELPWLVSLGWYLTVMMQADEA